MEKQGFVMIHTFELIMAKLRTWYKSVPIVVGLLSQKFLEIGVRKL